MLQQKRVRGPPSEEEGLADTILDELTSAPIPHPPRATAGRGGRGNQEIRSEVAPWKNGGVGVGVLRFAGYFSLPYSDFIGSEFSIFPKSSLLCL